MPSTPRAPRSPAKPKSPKSSSKSPGKTRKSLSRAKAGTALEGENTGDGEAQERRDSADVTMVGVDDVDAGDGTREKKGGKGKAVEKDGKRWDWLSLLDAKSSDHPAVFTKDARFFFLPSGASVNIHSASSGEVVSTLSAPHSAGKSKKQRITALALNPANAFQLLVAHLDGNLRVWDFLDGMLLRTVEVGQGITHMCVGEKLKDQVVVAVNEVKKKKGDSDAPAKPQTVLYRITLSTQAKSYIGTLRPASHLALSPSAQHLIATSESTAHVFRLPASGGIASVLKCHSQDRITALAFHPEEEWFATGDEIGTIKFWYCSSEPGTEQLPTASHLWHAHPVRALTFTPNGAYLLSAGEEAVIVAWQLHSGQREFVPRIGGPVRWLGVRRAVEGGGEEQWLAGLADRTLVWVGAGSLKVTRSVARVKLDISGSAEAPQHLPLAVHPETSELLLPSSHPSFLQVYSHATRSLTSELEVHPSNRVSKRNPDASPLPTARVERAVLSPGGHWMATLDVRRGGEDLDGDVGVDAAVVRLKVWRWLGGKRGWELNTRVERPHGTSEVTGLAWMPDPALHNGHGSGKKPEPELELGCLLATTGRDGNVKTWRVRVKLDEEGQEEVAWVARSSFSYRQHVPLSCAFSPDGSLLAVGQGPCVTLWDPRTNVLQRVLAGQGAARAEQVAFVGRDGRWVGLLESRVEGMSGKRKVRRNVLVLWDLLSCTVSWEYDLGVGSAQIVPQPSGSFAVFASSTDSPTPDRTRAFLFNPAAARPYRIQKLPFKLQTAVYYPLTPAQGAGELSFVGITKDMDVVLFGDAVGESEKPAPTTQKLGATAPAARTLFQEVFGITPLVDPAQDRIRPMVSLDSALQKGDDSLFDGPAYMLPAMSTLFQPFMDSMLKRRSAEEPASEPEAVEEPSAEVVVPVQKKRSDLAPHVVDDKEFDTFVELFKELASAPPARPQPRSTPITNGNGKARSKATNGVTPISARRTPATVVQEVAMEVDLPTPRAEEAATEETRTTKSVVPRKRGRKSSI